jgi:hypothetical protein
MQISVNSFRSQLQIERDHFRPARSLRIQAMHKTVRLVVQYWKTIIPPLHLAVKVAEVLEHYIDEEVNTPLTQKWIKPNSQAAEQAWRQDTPSGG